MAIIAQRELFSWKKIEALSDLDRLKLVLEVLPDEALMQLLEKRRGNGRNDYPIRPTWNAMIAGIVFQHDSVASLLRELCRNGELRGLCGFDTFLGAGAVPSDDAFSNFLKTLADNEDEVLKIFHQLVDDIGRELPDFGKKLAADSKAIQSYGKPTKDNSPKNDRRRDSDANWGKKVYRGVRENGTEWEKAKSWFGYKLHLLVDSAYELPMAFKVDKASSSDMTNLLPLLEDLKENHPSRIETAEVITADRGYDSGNNNDDTYQKYEIIPVIDKRKSWQNKETEVLYLDRVDVFTYDEDGKVFCTCPESEETRLLYFDGFDKKRNSLKYKCPAKAYGFVCKGEKVCGAKGTCGRVIRIPLSLDPRIFTPIARHTQKWKREYNRRSAVERVNSRIDCAFGFEKHTIRGMKKMNMRVSMALIVMLAMALGRIKTNQKERIRSLVKPVFEDAA